MRAEERAVREEVIDPLYYPGPATSPEQEIAAAVIRQAVSDALTKEPLGSRDRSRAGMESCRADARAFLQRDSESLQFWCAVAKLDPNVVVEVFEKRAGAILARKARRRAKRMSSEPKRLESMRKGAA